MMFLVCKVFGFDRTKMFSRETFLYDFSTTSACKTYPGFPRSGFVAKASRPAKLRQSLASREPLRDAVDATFRSDR